MKVLRAVAALNKLKEKKVGALIQLSLIEAIFVWIAGSIGMHLKKYSTNEQNEITKETKFN